MATEHEAIWVAQEPAEWPTVPSYLTYSVLREIERCPRRWALSAAEYPHIWSGHGYPPRPRTPKIAGSVVHYVIETIARSLVARGCPSMQAAGAVVMMRDLGGFSALLESATERALRPYVNNPRAQVQLEAIRRALRSSFADLRWRAQALLFNVKMRHSEVALRSGTSLEAKSRNREPLGDGSYAELEVAVPLIRWKGRIDLLTIDGEDCEVVDFKTGEVADEHALQVRIYALLWSKDKELNPQRRLATSLIVAYASGQKLVPAPTASGLVEIEQELIERTKRISDATQGKPVARPSHENCGYCEVRHLCDEYWTESVQAAVHGDEDASQIRDAELVVGARLGPSNWRTSARVAPRAWKGKDIVLRCHEQRVTFKSGERIRVVDARLLVEPDERETVTLNVGPMSELYVLR